MAHQVRYNVGIDVGSRSLGLSAIEIDSAGNPLRILNAMSHIHDGGVDPDSNKTALTRRNVSGVARRTRRMYRARRKRLQALDGFLTTNGYPLADLATTEDMAAWNARATLTSSKLTGDELKANLSLAMRHMARHRGWRNPYTATSSLYSPQQTPSPGFETIRESVETLTGSKPAPDATLAEMIVANPDIRLKLRGEGGLLSERLHQKDSALEIHKIARVQGFSEEFTRSLIDKVFAAKSPKGSAKDKVGVDELDRTQKRAWRATREFQEYRIIALLANVRIQERVDGKKAAIRPLNVEERNKVFNFLNTYTAKDFPTWEHVADLINVDRGDLKGTATSTDDGERVSSFPPINNTEQTFANAAVKEIRNFWKKANQASKDALVDEFSNVDTPEEGSPEGIAAATLLRNLPVESLEKIESIRLPDGRSAYSEKTLARLSAYMLENVADLHEARQAVFGVSDTWAPTVPSIGEPTGNPAVDRVIKAVNRWLLMAENRWGAPLSINIETLRDGFKSERLAREIDRDQNKRAQRNLASRETMAKALNIEGKPRRSELFRYQAIQRQNGQCAYCGKGIDFKSAELDHIVPRAGVGSTNARHNLLAACRGCNRDKGKLPFAVWAQQTSIPGVSLDEAIERVRMWPTDPGLTSSAMKKFQADVILRLRRVSEDDELDARSTEAVSWMAVELHRRIKGHFSENHTLEGSAPKVRVFRGEVTSTARKASGIDKRFKLLGNSRGKNRLDRRHHAVDAAVIALMSGTVAQVLTERNSLRSQQELSGIPDFDYGDWHEFTGRTIEAQVIYRRWQEQMKSLVPMLQKAVDDDRVPVVENIRLRLGNGLAHEETIHALERVQLGAELSVEQIDRAATPALWTALTRHPDFDWKTGLPEDSTRQITVNGTMISAEDDIELFRCKAGAIKVRGGYVELGAAFHHARLYKIQAGKKVSYAMMRVYTADLLKHCHEDLFSADLHPSTMSMRQAEPKLRAALRAGTAEYVTWFVVGDELNLNAKKIATGNAARFMDELGETKLWRVRGFYTETRLRLRPSQLASEGLTENHSSDSRKIIDAPGWTPALNKVFGSGEAIIVRRDAHGRARISQAQALPSSIKVE